MQVTDFVVIGVILLCSYDAPLESEPHQTCNGHAVCNIALGHLREIRCELLFLVQ